MAAINVRDVSKRLFNPWSIYLATFTSTPIDAQPVTPSFFTDRGIGINPLQEFVDATGYQPNSGVSYVTAKDLLSFKLQITYSIKDFVIESMQHVYGGTLDSAGTTLTWDGTAAPYFTLWAETCYNDDGKVIRLTLPKGKSVDTAEFTSGDTHVLIPTTFEALPDIDDTTTLPSLYFEP